MLDTINPYNTNIGSLILLVIAACLTGLFLRFVSAITRRYLEVWIENTWFKHYGVHRFHFNGNHCIHCIISFDIFLGNTGQKIVRVKEKNFITRVKNVASSHLKKEVTSLLVHPKLPGTILIH